jgi:imidazolonepropionase-like amidohydrolase
MRPTPKDSAGLALVLGTFALVFFHNDARHRETHLPTTVDAGGAITSAETVSTTAFVDFNVIPMDGPGMLRRQVVLVRDGFISRIGAVGVIDVPTGARVIEGDGSGYLVPGLVDAHVHLRDAREDLLPLYLANGVTTVFNLAGDERHLALRDRSRDPAFSGPTIFTAGPFVHDRSVVSPEEARRVVEDQSRAGYDFIKLHGELAEESYAALTSAAAGAGIAVVGHAPRNLHYSAVVEHGQVGIVHAEELIYTGLGSLTADQAAAAGQTLASAGTWVTPTMSTFSNITVQWGSAAGLVERLGTSDASYLPAWLRNEWESSDIYVDRPASERDRIGAMNAFHGQLVRAMDEAGVRMLTGTDAPLVGMVPGFALHDELDALEGAGVDPATVFEAATANAGAFVREHVDEMVNFGTLVVGARADVLLVEGDPRSELGLLRTPRGVMVRGTWYDRSALEHMLLQVSGRRIADRQ